MLKHGALIAINITISNGENNLQYVINSVPILYYWNGKYDMIESILNEKQITNLVKSYINNEHEYSNCLLNCISFDLDSSNEDYKEQTIKLQELYSLSNFNKIVNIVIDDVAKEVYKEVFNAVYTNQSNCSSIIRDVYSKVSLMYKDNITFETFMNFVRKKLQQSTSLDQKNIQLVVDNISFNINDKNIEDNH